MKVFCGIIGKLSEVMYSVAGLMLVFMMLLTTTDVILRFLGKPLPGTYELVGLTGAIVIGFAIPQTSLLKGHVYVEFLIDRFTVEHRSVVLLFVKIMVLLLFVIFGIYLFKMAADMAEAEEVTQNLRIPFYPITYAVGACCFIECLVMVSDMIKLVRGEYE
jgi:TRAP-type C4-dicarboxylate transport system permease small subunit